MTARKIALCLMIVAAAALPAACGKRGAPSRPGAETAVPQPMPESATPSQSSTPEQAHPDPTTRPAPLPQ